MDQKVSLIHTNYVDMKRKLNASTQAGSSPLTYMCSNNNLHEWEYIFPAAEFLKLGHKKETRNQ